MRAWLCSFLLLAAVAASPAQAAWREAKSKHFVIYSEQSAKGLQEYAETLERYDKGLRLLFNIPDHQVSHASRVTIFIVPNYQAISKLYGGRSSSGVAGFYKYWPGGSVAFVPRSTGASSGPGFDSNLVLQHEYAHHFLYQNFAGVFPAWFSEGFAEFASTAEPNRDGSVSFGMPANHRAYGLLQESPLPIEKLLNAAPEGRRDEVDKFYGRSWLLCHFLVVDPSRRGELPAYIKHLNSGKPNLDAARTAFGDLQKLDKDLAAYLRRIQSKMTAFRIAQKALSIEPVAVREMGPGETAMMNVQIQSKAGVDKQEAAQVVVMARKAAAPFATDAAVQTALAEAEFDAGNYAEAEAAADRAIAADPKSIDALTYKGAARMALVADSEDYDAASWAAVRKSFLAANRLDPEDPEPLALFFLSYLRQGSDPTPNAVAAGIRALELAPQDTGLRLTLTQYLLNHGRPAEARTALVRLASDPHDGELRSLAADMIAALDKEGAQAALGCGAEPNPTATKRRIRRRTKNPDLGQLEFETPFGLSLSKPVLSGCRRQAAEGPITFSRVARSRKALRRAQGERCVTDF